MIADQSGPSLVDKREDGYRRNVGWAVEDDFDLVGREAIDQVRVRPNEDAGAGSTCYNWRVSPSSSHEVNHMTWEEVPVCGVCGSPAWRPAGAVCQRRFAVCLECGVRRLYDRVAESSLGLLYG